MMRFKISLALSTIVAATLAAETGDLRLVDAVQARDATAIRTLLAQKADVNAAQPDGSTALSWAAHWDDLDTATLLIRGGANVNAANDHGATPLWLACRNGNAPIVALLLDAGANPNAALQSGETPLMAAVERSLDAVRLLLARGADVNAKETRRGQTALMWALAEKRQQVAKLLIEHGADARARSTAGFSPLMFAAQQGDIEAARMLVGAGADVNHVAGDGTTALLLAAAGGHEPLALFLLDRAADPNAVDADGYAVLHHAAAGRNMLALANALLTRGAKPNVRVSGDPAKGLPIGATPFFLAAQARNAEVMRALAAKGADPRLATGETTYLERSNGKRLQYVANTTPLMAAAGLGRYRSNYTMYSKEEEKSALEAVKVAADLGVDVNAVNEWGWTALHGASYIGADSIVQFLGQRGAKTEVFDKFGQTPLSIASRVITAGLGDSFDGRPRRIYENTVALLLKLGATPLEKSGIKRDIRY